MAIAALMGVGTAVKGEEVPSLDLTFDGQASSFTRATTSPTAAKANGDQLATDIISCTRSSTATFMGSNGLIQTAAVNTPRLEYDASGNPLGLLVEEARTNGLPESHPYGGSWWTSGDYTPTDNYGTAPDGTQTSVRYQYDASAGFEQFYRVSTTVPALGAVYTASIWYKGSGSFRINCQQSGTSEQTNAQFTATSQWQRAQVQHTIATGAGSGVMLLAVWMQNALGSVDIEFWGAQLEEGEAATSYIPTTSGAATRAADDITLSTSSFGVNKVNGTALVDATLTSKPSATYPGIFELSAPSLKYNLMTYLDTSLAQVSFQFSETNYTNKLVTSSVTYPLDITAAQRRDGTTGSGAVNGALLSGITIDTAVTDPTALKLGVLNGSHTNGHIRRFTYWPRAINDAQLSKFTNQ